MGGVTDSWKGLSGGTCGGLQPNLLLRLEVTANSRPASCGFEPAHSSSVLIAVSCTLAYVSSVVVGQWQQNWVRILFRSFLLFLISLLNPAVIYTINKLRSLFWRAVKLKASVSCPNQLVALITD